METVRPISEEEFVAAFLACEYDSRRFGDDFRRLLAAHGAAHELVLSPDLTDQAANEERRRLLKEFRAYGGGRGLLANMPDGVRWERAIATADDLRQVLYIDYSYWNDLSGGTRRPVDAVERIRAGRETFGQSNDAFWRGAEAVRNGVEFRPMILVSHDGSRWVVIEGHLRLTSYVLADKLPERVEVIAGRSARMEEWDLY
ncbi:MAG: hypothetical protein WD939_09730 [Dehalococcoidia bacterium]